MSLIDVLTPNLKKMLLAKAEDIGITPEQLLDEIPNDVKLMNYLENRCSCRTIGKDDGDHTCFKHHDCRDGSCTHTDGGDE